MGEEATSGGVRRFLSGGLRKRTDGDDGTRWLTVAAVLLLVLAPLLPFVIVAWLLSRTLRGVKRSVSWD
jgi:hypothetical protein